jgi:hypothetical protein
MLLLAIVSIFDNFLEVTRVAIPVWILAGAALQHAFRHNVHAAAFSAHGVKAAVQNASVAKGVRSPRP